MKYIFLLFSLAMCSLSIGQSFAIKQDFKSHFVNRIDNPLTVFGKLKNSYIVATDNGKIENVGENKFLVRPEKTGNLQIKITDKSGKLLYKENFIVKNIQFDVDFYGLKNGVENIDRFLNQNHLQLLSNDLVCLDLIWQWNFELIHVRQNEKYEITTFLESRSFDQLKEKLKPFEKGDILIFKNIKIFIDSFEYNIEDKVVYIN